MAKLESHLQGDFREIIEFIHENLWEQSTSLTLEETSVSKVRDRQIELRVYERYSYLGGNRASLTVQFIENGDGADVCGIASGGSNAVFWKINTFGESAFLETLETAISAWNSRKS
jgi:hypothetical protein